EVGVRLAPDRELSPAAVALRLGRRCPSASPAMPDDDHHHHPELPARLATAVVGSLLAHVLVAKALLLWTGSPDSLWRQLGATALWDEERAVLGAAVGLGLVAGVALATAEHLAALGRRRACVLVALALGPLGAGAAA